MKTLFPKLQDDDEEPEEPWPGEEPEEPSPYEPPAEEAKFVRWARKNQEA